ncbi:MAG: hypothetical protein ACFFBD_27075 [Candidatus Hodarchaeota archaeon]
MKKMERPGQINITQILNQKGIEYTIGEDAGEVEHYLNQTEALIEDVNENIISLHYLGVEFLKASYLLLNGELAFLAGRADVAVKYYQRSQKELTNLVEKNRETNLTDTQFLYETQRRLLHTQARAMDSQALELFSNGEYMDAAKYFQRASNLYNQEMEYERTNWDFVNIYITMRDFCSAYGFVLYSQAKALMKQRGNVKKAREAMYKALSFFKKAVFLGSQVARKKVEEIKTETSQLVFTRFELMFEELYNKGLEYAVEGRDYQISHEFFQKGSKICEGILKVQRKVEYELQEYIFRLSAYDSYAKFLLQEDKTAEASQTFQEAVITSRQICNLLEKWRMEALVDQFETQERYFHAMKVFAEGLGFFDEERATDAIKAFETAKTSLRKCSVEAKAAGNLPMVESCDSAIKQIESYLETAKVLEEPEDVSASGKTGDLFGSIEEQTDKAIVTMESSVEDPVAPETNSIKADKEDIQKPKKKDPTDDLFEDLFIDEEEDFADEEEEDEDFSDLL